MTREDWLKSLKPGDPVKVEHYVRADYSYFSHTKVDRINKRFLHMTSGMCYYRNSGCRKKGLSVNVNVRLQKPDDLPDS